MANTTSAKKATRKIARRTAVNKARRSRVRGFIRKVEEAIASGDLAVATEALKAGSARDSARRHPWRSARQHRIPQGVASRTAR